MKLICLHAIHLPIPKCFPRTCHFPCFAHRSACSYPLLLPNTKGWWTELDLPEKLICKWSFNKICRRKCAKQVTKYFLVFNYSHCSTFLVVPKYIHTQASSTKFSVNWALYSLLVLTDAAKQEHSWKYWGVHLYATRAHNTELNWHY